VILPSPSATVTLPVVAIIPEEAVSSPVTVVAGTMERAVVVA
jgi:hypothetical protein